MSTRAMAQPVLIEKDDLVMFRQTPDASQIACFVIEKRTTSLGWNEFDIMDFDGNIFKDVLRINLSAVENTLPEPSSVDHLLGVLNQSFGETESAPMDMPDVVNETIDQAESNAQLPQVSASTPSSVKTPLTSTATSTTVPATKRFKTVEESDLDSLANSTTAKTTDYQTKWAIRTLRGIFY